MFNYCFLCYLVHVLIGFIIFSLSLMLTMQLFFGIMPLYCKLSFIVKNSSSGQFVELFQQIFFIEKSK